MHKGRLRRIGSMGFSADATKIAAAASNVYKFFEVNGYVKHICCLFLAVLILILPLLGGASSVPANPMAQPGKGVIATVTPTPAATPAPTEVPTKAPTEVPTKAPTEVPTKAPTEVPTDAPTEVPTDAPTEAPTDAPTEVPTKAPTEAPTDAPTEVPTDAPTEAPTDAPTEVPTEAPAEEPEIYSAPAVPTGDYTADDDLLPEDIVKQLDAEVLGYLTGAEEPIAAIEGIRNILLVGVDARPGEKKSRSDTMMILTIDGKNNKIRLTSLMRDLYVAIPGYGNNRINAAWVYGEAELLKKTIEENFGLVIDEYVSVDLRVLIDVIDLLGGLTLNVETKKQMNAINGVIDAYNYQFREPTNDGLLTRTGEQLMNGKQVQAYARYRKIDSDIHRTARQREVLTKLFDKLQTKSIFELTKIASTVLGRMETNLTLSDVVSLIPVVYGMKDADFEQMNIPADVTYQNKTVRGMSVLVADMEVCRAKLAEFINGSD